MVTTRRSKNSSIGDGGRDQQSLNIRGSLINLTDPNISVNPLYWEIIDIAITAINLYRI